MSARLLVIFGGGLHCIDENKFLKLHAVFNWHDKPRLWLRVNVLVCSNEDRLDGYRGDLLPLRRVDNSASVVENRVCPEFNRTVIFRADENSLHEHP